MCSEGKVVWFRVIFHPTFADSMMSAVYGLVEMRMSQALHANFWNCSCHDNRVNSSQILNFIVPSDGSIALF
jgi:hypothetical protein